MFYDFVEVNFTGILLILYRNMQNDCPRAVLNSAICQKNEPARYRSLCCIVYAAEIDRLHGKLRPGSLSWNLLRLPGCLQIPQKRQDFLQK